MARCNRLTGDGTKWGKNRALALALVLLLALAGCGGARDAGPGGTTAARPGPPDSPATPTPRRGGRATIGIVGRPATLDPALDPTGLAAAMLRPVVEGLFDFDADGRAQPWLAETVPAPDGGGVAADGLVVIYRLRQGVAWEDGRPFTAADLLFTFAAYRDPDNPFTPAAAAPYRAIRAVDALDPYTVRVAYDRADADRLRPFALILPAHLFNGRTRLADHPYGRAPFGTGPFRVREWVPDEALTLARSPSYRDGGRPFLDEIVYRFYPDGAAADAALRSGGIDLLLDPAAVGPAALRTGPSGGALHGLDPARRRPATWNAQDWWREP